MARLSREFYDRNTVEATQSLLDKHLVRMPDGETPAGCTLFACDSPADTGLSCPNLPREQMRAGPGPVWIARRRRRRFPGAFGWKRRIDHVFL